MHISRLTASLLFSLVIFAGRSPAQDAKDAVVMGPLEFGRVGVKDGQFAVEELQQTFETQTRQRTIQYTTKVMGQPVTKEVTQNYTVLVPVSVQRQYLVPDESISFSTTSGKRVTNLEAVRKALAKGMRPAVIRLDSNLVDYQQVLKPNVVVVHLAPSFRNIDAYLQRGWAFHGQGEFAKAIAEFKKGTEIEARHNLYANLAWALATCPDEKVRDGKAAIEAAQFAEHRAAPANNRERALNRQNLAAAYAASGDFDQAATTMESAVQLLSPSETDLQDPFGRMVDLFKSKQIFIHIPNGWARVIRDTNGKVFQAAFEKVEGENVTLKKIDGTTVEFPLTGLSEEDRKWAQEQKK